MKKSKENRIKEIKNIIENEYKDWMNVKVLKIEPIKGNYKIHLIDSDGYKYCSTLDVIRNSVRRKSQLHKFFRNNIYTIDNIKNYIVLNNKNFTLVSADIKNATSEIICNCPIHGNFRTCWNVIKNGSGCPDCGKIQSAKNRRNSYEYVKSIFEKYDMVLISEKYSNNEEKLAFICNKHKDKGIQYMSFGQLITRKRCPECGKEIGIKKQTKKHEDFLEEVKLIHGDKYIVKGEYQKARSHIWLYCVKCDDDFLITPHHLLAGHGCPTCNISKGEEKIKLILNNNNVNFVQQYTFDDCRNKRCLPFDFAIFKNNELFCLIEYQGVQHYKPVEVFGGKEQFRKQQYIDNIKRQYCLNNKIKLIEIPHFKYKNIENILINEKVI